MNFLPTNITAIKRRLTATDIWLSERENHPYHQGVGTASSYPHDAPLVAESGWIVININKLNFACNPEVLGIYL